MKVLSVSTQKGGAGKTVATALLAVTLSQDYNRKVLLMDVDEQQTLTDIREQDKDYYESFPYPIISKPFRLLQETPQGIRTIVDENGDEVNPAADYIEELQEHQGDYDVVLVDMPGRTDDQNLLELMAVVDGLLVPVVTDKNDKLSTINYLGNIKKIDEYRHSEGSPFTYYAFQNKVEGLREEAEIKSFCDAIGINLFNTSLRKMAIYGRYNTYQSYLSRGSQIDGDYVPKTVKDELKAFTEEFIDKFKI